MNPEPLRFEIDPTPGESDRACAALLKVSLPPSRRTYVVLALYGLVILAAFTLTPETTAATTGIGVAAVLATVRALEAEGRSRVRRLGAHDPHARERHFVEVNAEGVRTWCAHIDARYPWAEVTRVVESSEFYLFARVTGGGAAVPKRLLDADRESDLRERIREWAPDRGASLARESGD